MNIVYHTKMITYTANRTYVSLFERHFSPFAAFYPCKTALLSNPKSIPGVNDPAIIGVMQRGLHISLYLTTASINKISLLTI